MAVTVASTEKKVAMIEAGANEIPEDVMLEGILFGHKTNLKIVQFIKDIQPRSARKRWSCPLWSPIELLEAVKALPSRT